MASEWKQGLLNCFGDCGTCKNYLVAVLLAIVSCCCGCILFLSEHCKCCPWSSRAARKSFGLRNCFHPGCLGFCLFVGYWWLVVGCWCCSCGWLYMFSLRLPWMLVSLLPGLPECRGAIFFLSLLFCIWIFMFSAIAWLFCYLLVSGFGKAGDHLLSSRVHHALHSHLALKVILIILAITVIIIIIIIFVIILIFVVVIVIIKVIWCLLNSILPGMNPICSFGRFIIKIAINV